MTAAKLNASAVFDEVKRKCYIPNDSALARALGVAPSLISAQRSGNVTFGPAIQRKILEFSGLSSRRMIALMNSDA